MTATLIVFGAIIIILLVFLYSYAHRLDRMQRRLDRVSAGLEIQLARRVAIALDMARGGVLDPVSSILVAEAAHDASVIIDTHEAELRYWSPTQSELSSTLRAALGSSDDIAALAANKTAEASLRELAACWYRITLARRFHNDAVADAVRLRRAFLVRFFHVAGHSVEPQFFDMDDFPPEGLAGLAG